MTRFLVLLLAAQLAALVLACGMASSGLGPEDAYAEAGQAIEAGDADRAVALLDEAADAGHLEALRRLTHAYKTGGLQATDRIDAPLLLIPTSERRAARYQTAYDRALGDAVRAGDANATLRAAQEVLGLRMSFSDRSELPQQIRHLYDDVDLDSARALYRRMERTNQPSLDLALVARALGDDDAFFRHIDGAIAAGDVSACIYKNAVRYGQPDFNSAAGLAVMVDRSAECDPSGELVAGQAGLFETLRESARDGAESSAALLDSLDQLGVFERYPVLAAAP